MRSELLDRELFFDLEEVQTMAEDWRARSTITADHMERWDTIPGAAPAGCVVGGWSGAEAWNAASCWTTDPLTPKSTTQRRRLTLYPVRLQGADQIELANAFCRYQELAERIETESRRLQGTSMSFCGTKIRWAPVRMELSQIGKTLL